MEVSGPEATGISDALQPRDQHEELSNGIEIEDVAELLALLTAETAAPPPEWGQLLARCLQFKEPLGVTNCLIEAMDRYAASDNHPLPVPI
jgi:hypothetical protein